MYNIKNETIRIDLNSVRDLKKYDEILNDPSCSIVREIREKITSKVFNEEGKLSGLNEELINVVTYQRKSLMEE